jgi:hypothetical protein
LNLHLASMRSAASDQEVVAPSTLVDAAVLPSTSVGVRSATDFGDRAGEPAVVTRKPRTGRVRRGYGDASPGELIPGLAQHSRYLSSFDEDVVRLDVSHHQDLGTDILEIDLRSQLIACDGGRSHYREPQPLASFPEALDALKVALNRTLASNHRGQMGTAILECRRSFLRIFSWMTRRCVYRFEDLDRDMIAILVDDVARNAWTGALGQTEHLCRVMERLRKDINLFQKLYSRYRNSKNFALPIEDLEAIGGLPLYEWAIPRAIYEELAAMEDDQRPIAKQDSRQRLSGSLHAIRDLMTSLNFLASSSPGSITFLPFPVVERAAKTAFNAANRFRNGARPDALDDDEKWPSGSDHDEATEVEHELVRDEMGRPSAPVVTSEIGSSDDLDDGDEDASRLTVNLSVDECARIFGEALRWTYDYAPVILSTLRFAREQIRGLKEDGNYWQKKAWQRIFKFYDAEAAAAGLTIQATQRNHGAQSFRKLVKTLQYALFVNLSVNSARRVNEVVGKRHVPYGLYLGALQRVQDEPPIHRLDFYVSKGPQQWFSFPANVLMVDAYKVLVELYELHEPFDADPRTKPVPVEEARKLKLFTSRDITPRALNSKTPREQFNGSERAEFLGCAGVDHSRFVNSRAPYRRIFSTLFMHRYDLREHEALQVYLGHLDAATTGGYYNDKTSRPPGESIQELHAPDYVDATFIKEMEVADLAYMALQLLRMLSGDAIGGGFPVVAAKLARRMSSEVSFVALSNELKAGALAVHLRQDGHRATALEHTSCMSGQPKKTGEQANCFHDGSLHREEASPKKCNGCVHSCASASYLENVVDQIKVAEEAAADANRPPAVRMANDRKSRILRDVLTSERRASLRNQNLFVKIQEGWQATVGAHVLQRDGSSHMGEA